MEICGDCVGMEIFCCGDFEIKVYCTRGYKSCLGNKYNKLIFIQFFSMEIVTYIFHGNVNNLYKLSMVTHYTEPLGPNPGTKLALLRS